MTSETILLILFSVIILTACSILGIKCVMYEKQKKVDRIKLKALREYTNRLIEEINKGKR